MKLFPEGKFLFMFYPASPFEFPFYGRLRNILRENEISFFSLDEELREFRRSRNLEHPQLFIPGDGHPGPVLNDFLATWLGEKLDL